MQMSYWRFAAMIGTSTLVMFVVMYLHTNTWDDVLFSETRAWMAVVMGAVMAIVMLAFMLRMYKSRMANVAIFGTAALVFTVATWLVRSQATVTGLDYMEAMVPHHSIAILTSEHARIVDPRVRKLANEIIESQRKEIAEMKYLIRALEREGVQPARATVDRASEIAAGDAARQADLATTDLETLTHADVQRVLGDGPLCWFAYAADAAPVAAATAGSTRGVIKLHGRLVPMAARYQVSQSRGFELSDDDVTVVTAADQGSDAGEVREAEARLRIGNDLAVGYAGFYRCAPA